MFINSKLGSYKKKKKKFKKEKSRKNSFIFTLFENK